MLAALRLKSGITPLPPRAGYLVAGWAFQGGLRTHFTTLLGRSVNPRPLVAAVGCVTVFEAIVVQCLETIPEPDFAANFRIQS